MNCCYYFLKINNDNIITLPLPLVLYTENTSHMKHDNKHRIWH